MILELVKVLVIPIKRHESQAPFVGTLDPRNRVKGGSFLQPAEARNAWFLGNHLHLLKPYGPAEIERRLRTLLAQ